MQSVDPFLPRESLRNSWRLLEGDDSLTFVKESAGPSHQLIRAALFGDDVAAWNPHLLPVGDPSFPREPRGAPPCLSLARLGLMPAPELTAYLGDRGKAQEKTLEDSDYEEQHTGSSLLLLFPLLLFPPPLLGWEAILGGCAVPGYYTRKGFQG